MTCEMRSVSTVRADKPARDLFCCQKEISDWKARHSKSRCSKEANRVMPSMYTEVSEISLFNKTKYFYKMNHKLS